MDPSGPGRDGQERWHFDLARAEDGLRGYVDLVLWPNRGVSWFSAAVHRKAHPLVIVVEREAPLPRRPGLALRTEGLWVDLVCETPLIHWSVGMEAFGVALDDPADALGACRGDRTPLGFDLEWEAVAHDGWEVSGEILIASDRFSLEGVPGHRSHTWGEEDWEVAGRTWLAELVLRPMGT